MARYFDNSQPLEDKPEDILAKAAKIRPESAATILRPEAMNALNSGKGHPGPLHVPNALEIITSNYFAMRVNCFLLCRESSGEAILFDTGADTALVEAALARRGASLASIYITHRHGDHIAVCDELCRSHGCCARGMTHTSPGAEPIIPGETLPTPFGPMRCEHIPGHAPDSLIYLLEIEGRTIVVLGDVLFCCSIGGISSAQGDSLAKIRHFFNSLPADSLLLPGHGPLTTCEHEARFNPFL